MSGGVAWECQQRFAVAAWNEAQDDALFRACGVKLSVVRGHRSVSQYFKRHARKIGRDAERLVLLLPSQRDKMCIEGPATG
jgi:hypothetical protein